MIEVTDAPTEKTRPTEILATRTGIDYARIYPRASQPESQEEAAPDQTKKAEKQSEYDLLGHLSKLPAQISIFEFLKTYPKPSKPPFL